MPPTSMSTPPSEGALQSKVGNAASAMGIVFLWFVGPLARPHGAALMSNMELKRRSQNAFIHIETCLCISASPAGLNA